MMHESEVVFSLATSTVALLWSGGERAHHQKPVTCKNAFAQRASSCANGARHDCVGRQVNEAGSGIPLLHSSEQHEHSCKRETGGGGERFAGSHV